LLIATAARSVLVLVLVLVLRVCGPSASRQHVHQQSAISTQPSVEGCGVTVSRLASYDNSAK